MSLTALPDWSAELYLPNCTFIGGLEDGHLSSLYRNSLQAFKATWVSQRNARWGELIIESKPIILNDHPRLNIIMTNLPMAHIDHEDVVTEGSHSGQAVVSKIFYQHFRVIDYDLVRQQLTAT